MPFDTFEKRQEKVAGRLIKAVKGSGSRILKQLSNKKNNSDEMKIKMEAMDDLFFAMKGQIDNGEMEPIAAIKDFATGAQAIFNKKA